MQRTSKMLSCCAHPSSFDAATCIRRHSATRMRYTVETSVPYEKALVSKLNAHKDSTANKFSKGCLSITDSTVTTMVYHLTKVGVRKKLPYLLHKMVKYSM